LSEERERRVEALLKATLDRKRIRADRLFVWLFIAQWAFAILLACVLSPFSWQGSIRTVHPHVELAIFGGLVLNALPCALIVLRPGRRSTRTTVAVAQMLWSSLLIHLTGGRIETHFHVFVSLVCIAFYADWRLLIPATFTVAVDHFVRGEFWPESVYGTATPEWWRFLEHAAWVMFEDFILILSCRRAIADARAVADREISLNEAAVRETELKIAERSTEIRANALHATTEQYRALLEATAAVPWEFDPASRRCVFIGRQVERLWGWPHERFDQEDFLLHCVHHGDRQRVMAAFDKSATSEESSIEYLLRRADGSFANVRTLFTRAEVEDGSHVVRGVTIDVTGGSGSNSVTTSATYLNSWRAMTSVLSIAFARSACAISASS
jgi:PAS domain-containing protein